jgi:hypothetical protein
MAMEAILTLVVVLGLPLWLLAEDLMLRFADQRAKRNAVEPKVAASPVTREPRGPLKRSSSHVM